MDENKIQLFEEQKIRTAWDEEKEEWYFSVVDVVGVLTEQTTQRGASNYWAKLKQRLKDEGASEGAVARKSDSPALHKPIEHRNVKLWKTSTFSKTSTQQTKRQ